MNTKRKYFQQKIWAGTIVLLTLVSACNNGSSDSSSDTPPSISANNPSNLAIDVPINQQITATFSEAMNGATIINSSFIVTDPNDTTVAGTVSYDESSKMAVFAASSDFTSNTSYQALITTDVTNVAGIGLANDFTWTFTTSAAPDITAPVVVSNYPVDLSVDFAINRNLTVEFNEALDPDSVNTDSFTLSDGANEVASVISFQGTTATLNPNENLAINTLYTATLTTEVTDLASPSNAMTVNFSWSFTTSASVAAGPNPIDLQTSADFAILSKTGITNVPTSAITGNIGASPITAAAMDNVFCSEISGTIYGSNAAYTGSGAITCFAGAAADNTLVANAVLDMGTAYSNAAGRTLPDFTELGAGDISGMTLEPGLYKWSSGLLISTDVTLSGGANDVWIFQVAGDITQADASSIVLDGGALAKNIFWQVGGGTGVAIGTTAHFEGIVLAEKGITLNTGAVVNGRLLSQTAVTLDQNVVTEPAQ